MNNQGPIILSCPSCGATQRLEEHENVITCQYCGNRILMPEEFRSRQPAPPPPVQARPPATTQAPAPEAKNEIPPQVIRKRANLIVWLTAAMILCAGLATFLFAAGGDTSPSSSSSEQTYEQEVPAPNKLHAPTPPVLPTFTPIAELLLKFGEEGTSDGQMDDARDIAVDAKGNIFVGDYSGGRIQKFDPQGNFLLRINLPANDSGTEVYTGGIGVDSQGRLYAVRNGDILIYDGQNGSLLQTLPGGWPEVYYEALIVANDFIYSTNGMAATDDILQLSLQGDVLLHQQDVIESIDKDDPALNLQLAVDPQGQIYILSNFGPHIYVYDAQGEYLRRFGEQGRERGQIDLSTNLLAIDPRGRLYVASSYRIDQFDAQGNYLNYSLDVSDDSENGVPMGMTFDSQGYLYLTCNNGKILKYQINSR